MDELLLCARLASPTVFISAPLPQLFEILNATCPKHFHSKGPPRSCRQRGVDSLALRCLQDLISQTSKLLKVAPEILQQRRPMVGRQAQDPWAGGGGLRRGNFADTLGHHFVTYFGITPFAVL